MDNKIYAFDSETGAELWSFDLPAGGQATPMTYTLNGKQYLVIAAGGHGKLSTKQGDSVLAFNNKMGMIDSYTPIDERLLSARDLDLGSSNPVVFPFGNRTLVAPIFQISVRSSGHEEYVFLST